MAKEYLTKLSQKELLGVTKTTLDAIVSLYNYSKLLVHYMILVMVHFHIYSLIKLLKQDGILIF